MYIASLKLVANFQGWTGCRRWS